MTDVGAKGVPYPSEQAGPVDEWSEEVYRALRDWPVSRENEWTRWEPGYLLLTIDQVDGRPVEPVRIDSAEGEVTVEFGYWETHNPGPFGLWDAEADEVAGHAKALAQQWLSGELRTMVFTTSEGTWCGSMIVEPGELAPQLRNAAQYLRDFQPVRVELRSVIRSEWESFAVEPDWLVPQPLSPERLS